jgi:tRNA(fMet)-specific endonuclease VapC
MSYLLDTDTCIYWLRGRESVKQTMLAQPWNTLAICVITVAELYFGAYNSTRIEQNLTRAERFMASLAVLSLDAPALKTFGELKSQLRKTGQSVADFDLLIASIALANKRILVTNNTRHYERIPNLQIQNWVN